MKVKELDNPVKTASENVRVAEELIDYAMSQETINGRTPY